MRKIFEHANDAIFVTDPERDRILDANPRACEMLGFTREEMLATPISGIHPDEMSELFSFAHSVLREGGGWTDRLTCLTKSGARLPAEISASPVEVNGRPCLVSIVRAVHSEHNDRSLRAILEGTASVTGEAFFRSLVEHLAPTLGVGYAIVAELAGDGERMRTLASWAHGGFAPNFEYDPSVLPDDHLRVGETAHAVEGADLGALAAQAQWRGSPPVSYLGVPLRDSRGNVRGHLAVMDNNPMPVAALEMSVFRIFAERARAELERARVERALRESENRFQTLARLSPSVLFRADPNGHAVYVNERWTELTGRSIEEVMGDGWLKALHPEDRERAGKAWEQAVRERQPYREEFRFTRTDGTPVWVTGQAEPELDAEGNVISFVGTVTDISQQKAAEEQLRSAKRGAEVANRAKSEFLTTMSHELRTPLNSILGYAQLLGKDTSLTQDQRDAIATVHQSGEHLLNLINDLLDLSKIEAGKLEVRVSEIRLPSFLHSIAESIRIRAEAKGLQFSFEPDEGLPEWVHTDESRVRQILVNLLGNAVKFTDQGSVRFGVQYNNGRMRFRISDTGRGIPEDWIQNIFLPFTQVPDTQSRTEGTGLGLAICKKLADILNASLQVENNTDGGSTFTLDLVLPELAFPINSEPGLHQNISGYQGPQRKTWVIDNDPHSRQFLLGLLAPLGFQVNTAATIDEVHVNAADDPPDIVLVDLYGATGISAQAAKQLQDKLSPTAIPVIAISASAYDEHRRQSLESGCCDFVSKPIRIDELLATMQRHLQLQWTYRTAGDPDTPMSGPNSETTAFEATAPAVEQLRDIRDMAQIGDIQGIVDAAGRLGRSDPRLQPLADTLRQHAKGFQVARIRKLVDQCLSQ